MRKLFLAMMACAGMWACTDNDVVVNDNPTKVLEGDVAYLTVRIKDVNSSSTRATDGGYAYGTDQEQTVSNAYFYFYDDNGNYVAKGSATPTGEANDADPEANIEWNSETVVAVWGLNGNLPTKMVTVLNKPSGVDFTNKSLDEALAALAGTPYADANGNFVMSTSVYEGTNGVVNYTALDESDFQLEPVSLTTDYPNGGVDVYVERLAAKVVVSLSSSLLDGENGTALTVLTNGDNRNVYNLTDAMLEDFAKVPETSGGTSTLAIQILGWDVDGTARDAYVVKNIDTSWDFGNSFTWNASSDYRSYWAASPNYGVTHEYPTSSLGNTDADEETSPLDSYLKYTSLASPVTMGSATYCGENTNTTAVLVDETSTGLTNILVKAQFGIWNPNNNALTGVDIVKYHGEYIPLEDFEEDMITEVMTYDFKSMVDQIEAALEESASSIPFIGDAVKAFAEAVEPVVYMKKTSDSSADYEVFDNRFMQLYSQSDGKVSIWFDTATSVDTEGSGQRNHSDHYGYTIPDYYTATELVKEASESMDDYDFFFKLDADKIEAMGTTVMNLLEGMGFITVEDGDLTTDYYLPLADNFTIDVQNSDGSTNHSYTARNYLVRAIEREAAGINDDWSTAGYPILYNGGMMYYYVPIQHLASSTGDDIVEAQYGVVRNHWYSITVGWISQLGHGIADEAEVIVPQPEEDYYYLGADVNILSWKMVESTVGW